VVRAEGVVAPCARLRLMPFVITWWTMASPKPPPKPAQNLDATVLLAEGEEPPLDGTMAILPAEQPSAPEAPYALAPAGVTAAPAPTPGAPWSSSPARKVVQPSPF